MSAQPFDKRRVNGSGGLKPYEVSGVLMECDLENEEIVLSSSKKLLWFFEIKNEVRIPLKSADFMAKTIYAKSDAMKQKMGYRNNNKKGYQSGEKQSHR